MAIKIFVVIVLAFACFSGLVAVYFSPLHLYHLVWLRDFIDYALPILAIGTLIFKIGFQKMRKPLYFVISFFSTLLLPLWAYAAAGHFSSLCIKERIKLGENFILDKLAKDQFYLYVTQVPKGCPAVYFPFSVVTETLNFSSEALGDDLPLWAKKKMIDYLMKAKFYYFSMSAPFYGPAWKIAIDSPTIIILDSTGFAFLTLDRFGYRLNLSALNKLYSPPNHAYLDVPIPHPRYPVKYNYTSGPTIKDSQPTVDHPETFAGIHAEVNATVWLLFHERGLDDKINFNLIEKAQSPKGYFYNYGWDIYYSTHQLMKVLCATHRLPERVAKGIEFLKSAQLKDGSWGNPYYTGLALDTLFSCNYNSGPTVDRGIQYLLSHQNASGDWYGVRDNNNFIWWFLTGQFQINTNQYCRDEAHDNNHILSTSFAILALKQYLKAHPDKDCFIPKKQ